MQRRDFIYALGPAALAWMALPGAARAGLVATPRQTAGPFYPDRFPQDVDDDLVSFEGGNASGQVLHLSGRVLDADGQRIDGAVVEIWQCDYHGFYHHSSDRVRDHQDPNFQGYGKTHTAGQGDYRFRTIVPRPYPGRTPHVHYRVEAPGFEPLTTQMYNAAEARRNANDGLYRRLSDSQRDALTVGFTAADDGALQGKFDLVLG